MVGVSCSCRGSRLVRSVGSVAAFVCVETGLRGSIATPMRASREFIQSNES